MVRKEIGALLGAEFILEEDVGEFFNPHPVNSPEFLLLCRDYLLSKHIRVSANFLDLRFTRKDESDLWRLVFRDDHGRTYLLERFGSGIIGVSRLWTEEEWVKGE